MTRRHQALLFRAMTRPGFFAAAAPAATVCETHISKVFLTPTRAYKVKKAVDFGFLDFSTLAQRRAYCTREVELNRRLAPSIYLKTVPITYDGARYRLGGAGEVVEYAVCMRRLPARQSLSARLTTPALGAAQMQRLAQVLTRFYDRSQPEASIDAPVLARNVKAAVDENFRQIAPLTAHVLDRETFAQVRQTSLAFLRRRGALLADRVRQGHIVDGHGDLRCEHIYFRDNGRIQIIDCLEFSDALRCIDTASDLAFLAMDLDRRGYAALGHALLAQYAAQRPDPTCFVVLPFYKCYRAMVRCKVACLQMEAKGRRNTALRRRARQYLEMARQYAVQYDQPVLYALCGLPGSGKSALARVLAQARDIACHRSDEVRKRLHGLPIDRPLDAAPLNGIYAPEASRRTYDQLLAYARDALRRRRSVVLDAAFLLPEDRRRVRRLAAAMDARHLFVERTAPEALLQQRLRKREIRPGLSDARLRHLPALRARYTPLGDDADPWSLTVDNTAALEDSLRKLLYGEYIRLPFDLVDGAPLSNDAPPAREDS
jgi:aminoglycoside phosphotransferase family enzyme/predicted kinase